MCQFNVEKVRYFLVWVSSFTVAVVGSKHRTKLYIDIYD